MHQCCNKQWTMVYEKQWIGYRSTPQNDPCSVRWTRQCPKLLARRLFLVISSMRLYTIRGTIALPMSRVTRSIHLHGPVTVHSISISIRVVLTNDYGCICEHYIHIPKYSYFFFSIICLHFLSNFMTQLRYFRYIITRQQQFKFGRHCILLQESLHDTVGLSVVRNGIFTMKLIA